MAFSQSQADGCGTYKMGIPEPSACDNLYDHSNTPPDFSSYDPKLYNVKFWPIFPENGPSSFTFTEEDELTIIANLNREFNRFRIYFKYRGSEELYR